MRHLTPAECELSASDCYSNTTQVTKAAASNVRLPSDLLLLGGGTLTRDQYFELFRHEASDA